MIKYQSSICASSTGGRYFKVYVIPLLWFVVLNSAYCKTNILTIHMIYIWQFVNFVEIIQNVSPCTFRSSYFKLLYLNRDDNMNDSNLPCGPTLISKLHIYFFGLVWNLSDNQPLESLYVRKSQSQMFINTPTVFIFLLLKQMTNVRWLFY